MIVSESAAGGSYSPCPSGSYVAKCMRLVDLGTVQSDFQGEAKSARKVLLSFEVLDQDTRRDDGEPFILSRRFTLSLHEKSALRQVLASWRGRDFTPEELRGFDMRNILGQPCFLSVVESVKGDRQYSNIGSIVKAPRGLSIPESVEPLVYWSMSDPAPDWEAYGRLGSRLQAAIAESPEYERLRAAGAVPRSIALTAPAHQNAPQRAAAAAPVPAPHQPRQAAPAPVQATSSGFDDMDSDIPF